MSAQPRRLQPLAGVLAVALWATGLVIYIGFTSQPSDHASDAAILAWAQQHTTAIIVGAWLFMIGCLCLVWFAGILRERLASAEDAGTFASIAFGGAVAAAVFGIGMPAGDLVIAIDKNEVDATTAGALHHLTDLFFIGAELSEALFLAAVVAAVWRSAVLPRWWAILTVLLAVVLLVGPIGWAGLLFGTPVWVLGTSAFLLRRPAVRRAATIEPAEAY
ncbi:MAG TPA: hypothetical protein VH538_11275 [Gaiellaceae bacterium]|jgi:hypothetical protein